MDTKEGAAASRLTPPVSPCTRWQWRVGHLVVGVVTAAVGDEPRGEELYQPSEQEERALLSGLLAQLPALPCDKASGVAFGEAVVALEARCAKREDYVAAEVLRTLRLAFTPASQAARDDPLSPSRLLERGFVHVENAVPIELLHRLQRVCLTVAGDTTAPLPCLHLHPVFIECLSLSGEPLPCSQHSIVTSVGRCGARAHCACMLHVRQH